MRWKSRIPYVLLELYNSLDKIIGTDTAKKIARLRPTQEFIETYNICYDISENILNEKLKQLQ